MELVNMYKFKEVEYTNKENAMIKNTQNSLNQLEHGDLPAKMFKRVIKAMMEDKPVVSSVCDEVRDYLKAFQNNLIEGPNFVSKELLDFIGNVKKENDFIKGYVVKEDIEQLWIVIKEANFNNNKKYLKNAREFKGKNNYEFDIVIFDEKQIDGVNEQLEFYEQYEVITKDA